MDVLYTASTVAMVCVRIVSNAFFQCLVELAQQTFVLLVHYKLAVKQLFPYF